MKRTLNKRSMIFADIIPLIVFFLCIIVVAETCKTDYKRCDTEIASVNDGWVTSEGENVSLDHLPKNDVVITHDLKKYDLTRKRLCFISTHTHIKCEADGMEIYDYAPVQCALLGKSYGMYIHMIPIPEDASAVTLKLHSVYDNTPPNLKKAAIEDAALFIADIYHDGLPSFALSMMISLYGVLMLIVGIPTLFSNDNSSINFFSLGAFAILVGLWTTNETMILQVYTQHPEIARFLNYLCLIFISFPPTSFIASATNQRKSILLKILMGLTVANFFCTMIFSMLRICDIRDMLLFSHINIAFAMITVIYLLIRSVVKKTADSSFLKTIVIGITPAIIGVAIDLIRFRVFPENHFNASMFTKFGVEIFVVLMGVHLLRERTRLAVEQGQAELMKKLAYTDGLTELSNRAAFHEKEEEIRMHRSKCVIVQLDINFLKRVNDEYGHAEGDRHIINASHIIRDSFAQIGISYRTGGDEFIVVVQDAGIDEVQRSLENMEKLVESYNSKENPPVHLQIAYGYAQCSMASDMLEEAEKLADSRMYEKKKQMKIPLQEKQKAKVN